MKEKAIAAPERLEQDRKFKDEGIVLLMKINVLHSISGKLLDEIETFHKQVGNDGFDLLDWETKEALLKQNDELDAKLQKNAEWLRKLEEEYTELRDRVNTYHGREVMPAHEGLGELSRDIDDEEEEEDGSNWWRKEV